MENSWFDTGFRYSKTFCLISHKFNILENYICDYFKTLTNDINKKKNCNVLKYINCRERNASKFNLNLLITSTHEKYSFNKIVILYSWDGYLINQNKISKKNFNEAKCFLQYIKYFQFTLRH